MSAKVVSQVKIVKKLDKVSGLDKPNSSNSKKEVKTPMSENLKKLVKEYEDAKLLVESDSKLYKKYVDGAYYTRISPYAVFMVEEKARELGLEGTRVGKDLWLYNEWVGLGYKIKTGSKSIQTCKFKITSEDGGNIKGAYWTTYSFFHKSQVEKVEVKKASK